MIDLGRFVSKHRVGERMALADRNRGQVDAVGYIADSVNVRDVGLRERIDRNFTLGPGYDADLVQPEAVRVRAAANGEHDGVGCE